MQAASSAAMALTSGGMFNNRSSGMIKTGLRLT